MQTIRAIFRFKTQNGIEQHTGPWFIANNWAGWHKNYTYVSPADGEVWGKLIWEGNSKNRPSDQFNIISRTAATHARWHGGDIPGSLLLGFEFIYILPPSLLQYELDIQLKRLDERPPNQESLPEENSLNAIRTETAIQNLFAGLMTAL
jgi:hypothetical protein